MHKIIRVVSILILIFHTSCEPPNPSDHSENPEHKNSDTRLSELSISSGILSPEFRSDVFSYTANVSHSITTVTVTAVPVAETSMVTVVGNNGLIVGTNLVTVTVSAENGNKKVYAINVNRASASASSDALLSEIGLSSGSLTPEFSSDVYSYTATVDNSVSTLKISATTSDSNATLTGTGEYTLYIGLNNVILTVTAEDGMTQNQYEIVINRLEPGFNDVLNIVGFRQSSEQNLVAFNWEKGFVDLENNTHESVGTSGARFDTSIYISGYTQNPGSSEVACVWVNHSRIDLENNTFSSRATDIFIYNNDIYACGYTQNHNGNRVACYWVNGVRVDLEQNSSVSEATGIFVENGTVYVSGFTKTDLDDNPVACYWNNEIRIDLGDNSYISEALDITVNDTDVYIAGYTRNPNNYAVACFWQNTDRVDLVNNTYESKALSIYFDGDVYTCGFTQNSNNYAVACYWQNTTRNDLENNTRQSVANTITRINNKILLAGFTKSKSGNDVACYWDNLKRIDIGNNTYSSQATGLFY